MITPQTNPSKFLPGGGIEDLIRKMKEGLIKYMDSVPVRKKDNSKVNSIQDSSSPKGAVALNPQGLLARVRQRILVVEASKNQDGTILSDGFELINSDVLDLGFASFQPGNPDKARILRISEYPNAFDEFGVSSFTLLLEWDGGLDFIQSTIASMKKNGSTIKLLAQADQVDNLVINSDPPPSKPQPPFETLSSASGKSGKALLDYSKEADEIIGKPRSRKEPVPPKEPGKADKIKVVVSDTGLKFNLPPDQEYPTNDGREVSFPIARNPRIGDPNTIGFCSITDYLFNNYIPRLGIPQGPTGGVDTERVLKNPTDDNEGRHGTHVTGIISQNSAESSEVIPLKIFDFLGQGTLFDILCGFNYVFARLDAGENIRIMNASWSGHVSVQNRPLFSLLENKIRALQKRKVFVIASAGNRHDPHLDEIGNDISVEQMIPACYSGVYDNVITVTTVAEKWKKQPKGFRSKSRNIWKDFMKHLYHSIPDGYLPVENFSATYVQVGVVAHPLGGYFPTPFGGEPQLPIVGSSFAAAYMSAYVVQRLTENPDATRADMLGALKKHSSLYPYIQQGRYLELETVNGKSTEENFEPVVRAMLSRS